MAINAANAEKDHFWADNRKSLHRYGRSRVRVFGGGSLQGKLETALLELGVFINSCEVAGQCQTPGMYQPDRHIHRSSIDRPSTIC